MRQTRRALLIYGIARWELRFLLGGKKVTSGENFITFKTIDISKNEKRENSFHWLCITLQLLGEYGG